MINKRKNKSKYKKNFFYNIKILIACITAAELLFVSTYIIDAIKTLKDYDESTVLCTIIVFIASCLLLNRLMNTVLSTKLNYLEYSEFLKKQIDLRTRFNLKSPILEDELFGIRYIMQIGENSNTDIKNIKTREYTKRYKAENYFVKGQLNEAEKVIDSFDFKVKDFRDKYFKLILLKDYEGAIKVIDSIKNRYVSSAVINSFWKGFCFYKIGIIEEALKEFLFVSKFGGDTKYKVQSDIYIQQLKGDYDCQGYDIGEEKRRIKVDKVYKDINLWIYLLIILVVVMIQLFV